MGTETERKQEKKPNIARELWFQENEKELIERKEITATVRAGDRTLETENPKGGDPEGKPTASYGVNKHEVTAGLSNR